MLPKNKKPKEEWKDYITDSKLMVLYVLLKYTDENHMLEKKRVLELIAAEFGERREINVKTLDTSLEAIERFLEEKSDIFGSYKSGAKNGKKMKTNIRIEHLFSDHELRYLIDMVSSCEYIKLSERKELIQKLLTLSSKNLNSDLRPYLLNNQKKTKVMTTDFGKNLKVIHKAIIEKKQIQFHRVARQMNGSLYYETDKNGDDKVYTVNPYRTVFSDGFYYLVCSRERSDNSAPDRISNYRIDRISDVTLIENKDIYPETSIAGASKNVDTYKYISTHRMMWGGTPETITFRCPEWAITEIVDYFSGDYEINSNEEDAETGEKMMIVKVESTQDNMLIWARSFFDFVEIISPASLRQILKDDIAKAYKKYSKSD